MKYLCQQHCFSFPHTYISACRVIAWSQKCHCHGVKRRMLAATNFTGMLMHATYPSEIPLSTVLRFVSQTYISACVPITGSQKCHCHGVKRKMLAATNFTGMLMHATYPSEIPLSTVLRFVSQTYISACVPITGSQKCHCHGVKRKMLAATNFTGMLMHATYPSEIPLSTVLRFLSQTYISACRVIAGPQNCRCHGVKRSMLAATKFHWYAHACNTP